MRKEYFDRPPFGPCVYMGWWQETLGVILVGISAFAYLLHLEDSLGLVRKQPGLVLGNFLLFSLRIQLAVECSFLVGDLNE